MTSETPNGPEGTRLPKHQELFAFLKAAVVKGEFPPGSRLPTEAELVEQFGLSRTTVNRALSDLQSEGVVVRRRGAGTFVPEVDSAAKQATLWFMFPPLEPGSLFLSLQHLLFREAGRLDWSVSFCEIPGDASAGEINDSMAQAIGRGIDGLFYVPHAVEGRFGEINRTVIETVSAQTEARIVLLDRDIRAFPGRSRYDIVCCDDQRGSYLVTDHLVDRGCARLVFVDTEDALPSSSARYEGFRLAVEMRGLKAADVARGDPDVPSFMRNIIREHKPDGIVCVNDYVAAKVMRQLLALDVRIPDDVRLSGFDDTPTADLLPVPLTTVRQDMPGIASWAITLMANRIENPAQKPCVAHVDCELVERASTA